MSVINQKTTLFVGGLTSQATESILHAAFIPFGDIVKIQIPTDSETNEMRGFAFIEYELPQDCQEALYNMHLSELHGKLLKVQLARTGKYHGISTLMRLFTKSNMGRRRFY
jgi:peptidyl-prolyl isomerase E (cyclophilin E)